MAQLKDTTVSGSLRVTDTLYTTTNQFQILRIPTSSDGTTYGPGTNGQILKSNGTSVYWADDNATDSTKLPLSGGTLTGRVSTSFPINQVLANGTVTDAVTTSPYKSMLWTFNNNINPTNGDHVIIKTPHNGHSYGIYLSLDNGSHYHPITRFGTNRLTTHYPAGTFLHLVYSSEAITNTMYPFDGGASTVNVTGSWQIINDYDSGNSTDRKVAVNGANRIAETEENGGIGLFRYSLQLMTINQTWSSIACASGSTAATQTTTAIKVPATANFLLNSPILYMDTNPPNSIRVAPGTGASVYGYTAMPIDIRYNTSGTISLTTQKPVYLVGRMNADGSTFKLLSSNWWTQDLPATNDGNIYILLGLAYNATNIYLLEYHPIFYHNGTNLVQFNPGTSNSAINDGGGNNIVNTYFKKASIIYQSGSPTGTYDEGTLWLQPI